MKAMLVAGVVLLSGLWPAGWAGAACAGAVDFDRGAIGLAWNYGSKAAARGRAIREARAAGGRNVRVVFSALSRGYTGIAFGRTRTGRGVVSYGRRFHTRSSLRRGLIHKLRSLGATRDFRTLVGRNLVN